jgi:hypothetical protein
VFWKRRVLIDRCSYLNNVWKRITGPSNAGCVQASIFAPFWVLGTSGSICRAGAGNRSAFLGAKARFSLICPPSKPFRCLHGARIRAGARVNQALGHYGAFGQARCLMVLMGTGQRFRRSEKNFQAYLWQYSRTDGSVVFDFRGESNFGSSATEFMGFTFGVPHVALCPTFLSS